MKTIMLSAISGFTFVCAAAGQEILSCIPVPQNPAVNSTFVIRASGTFPTTGYAVDWNCQPGSICYQVQSNHFRITITYMTFTGHEYLPVVNPWQRDITIYGLSNGRLPHGGYRATVTFVPLTTGPTTSATTTFVVGSPTASWLTTSESNMVFYWASTNTLRYSVQSTTQLTANAWSYIPSFSNVNGDPLSMQYQAPFSNEPLRIFRLISAPK